MIVLSCRFLMHLLYSLAWCSFLSYSTYVKWKTFFFPNNRLPCYFFAYVFLSPSPLKMTRIAHRYPARPAHRIYQLNTCFPIGRKTQLTCHVTKMWPMRRKQPASSFRTKQSYIQKIEGMNTLVWQKSSSCVAIINILKSISVKRPASRHVIIPFISMASKNANLSSHTIHSVKEHLSLAVFVRHNF